MIEEQNSIPKSAFVLGWLGVVPFAFFTLLSVLGTPLPPADALNALFAYGALILSFMGGVQWGFGAVQTPDTQEDFGTKAGQRLAISVLPALAAFGLWFLSARIGLLGLAIAFALLLLYDLRSVRQGVAPHWYGALRIQLTSAVIGLLALAAAVGGA